MYRDVATLRVVVVPRTGVLTDVALVCLGAVLIAGLAQFRLAAEATALKMPSA